MWQQFKQAMGMGGSTGSPQLPGANTNPNQISSLIQGLGGLGSGGGDSNYQSFNPTNSISRLNSFGGGNTGGSNMFNNGQGIMGNLLSHKGTDGIQRGGWGGMAVGLGQGLLSGYQGMKQFGLAEKQLKQGQYQFDKNYAAQKATTNAGLEDRQRARVASNEGAYQSVGDYMKKHGIK